MEAGRGLITNRGRRGNEQHWRARDMKRCPEGKGLRRSASRPNGREDEDDDEVEGKEEMHKSRKPNDGNRKIATEPRPRRPTRTEPPLSPPARAAERPLFFFAGRLHRPASLGFHHPDPGCLLISSHEEKMAISDLLNRRVRAVAEDDEEFYSDRSGSDEAGDDLRSGESGSEDASRLDEEDDDMVCFLLSG